MKVLIPIVIGLLVVGCGKKEQPNVGKPAPTTNANKGNGTEAKPVKELTLEEKVVGEYESIYNGKTYKRVFLKNGIVEWYVNAEIRAAFGSEYKDIYRINTDRSITHIAYIDNGEREDFPKEGQVTYRKIK